MKRFAEVVLVLMFFPVLSWSLQVVPAYQIFRLKRGEQVEGQVTLFNSEDEEIQVIPSTKNWFVYPANKKIKVEDWLVVDTKAFSLKPGESKVVQFKAQVPKKAVGELCGMVSLLTKTKLNTSVQFMMSVAVYVSVVGTEKRSSDVVAFQVTPSNNSVSGGVEIENKGNVHIRPKGWMRVINDDLDVHLSFELGNGQPIYPGRRDVLVKEIKNYNLPSGSFRVEIEMDDRETQERIINVSRRISISENRNVKLK